ncbi:hypothetical protein BACCAC_00750 [Bacteroides caccae ATCC 43185]|nr:hypothetical protein CGC64_12830 [Bacteroides caccae]EDM22369.1 hypothetical protein BACCAC_00750 [Bacteroides caccae ATCC 43185]PQL34543.1 hypothetical protein C5Z00_07460 [Bacteroides caccae]
MPPYYVWFAYGHKKSPNTTHGQITLPLVKKYFCVAKMRILFEYPITLDEYFFAFPLYKDTKKQGEKRMKVPIYRGCKEFYYSFFVAE